LTEIKEIAIINRLKKPATPWGFFLCLLFKSIYSKIASIQAISK
jgi:hypothetical protein